jgi:hypothetical protein
MTPKAIILSILVAPVLHAATVDLSTWTVQNYSSGAGSWNVASGGGSVLQTINGNPTVFLSDQSAVGTSVKGKIKVETSSDDDFIGFVLGFNSGDFSNPLADFLLVDWKQGDQFPAVDGLAVSRVQGVVPNADNFWQHNGSVTELARGATLGSTGWADNTEYTFEFNFTSSSLEVLIDGVSQININGSFSAGNLGFYNYSQGTVRYSGVTQDELPPTPSVPDGGSGLVLLGISLAGLGISRRALRKA